MSDDVIKQMREKAHAIALERRKAWWDGMTPAEQKRASASIREAELGEHDHLAEFKPAVIELEEGAPASPYLVQTQLVLIGCFMSLEALGERSYEERRAASWWASTAMLSASDNDVILAPRPEWLPERDSASVDQDYENDIERNGGLEHARRIWDTEWPKPDKAETVDEPISDEQALFLDLLERVDEIRTILRITLGLETPEAEGPDDTSVDRERLEGSPDGNDSTTEFSDRRHTISDV